jgi:hypothetical protein
MKKILLLFLIIATFPTGLIAQDDSGSGGGGGGGFFAGAKAAFGMVKFESVTSVKNLAEITWDNLAYGIVAGYNLTGNLSLQVEGVYSQYGADNIIPTYIYSAESPLLQTYNSNSVVDHVDMDIYNVDIPLLFKYTAHEIGFSPYFYLGADWGINVLSTTTIVRAITTESEVLYRDYKSDITDRIKYYEFAPVAGLGVKMDMGSLSVFGDLRYKYGLMNLSNVDNGLGFTNSAIWLNAGLVFNF